MSSGKGAVPRQHMKVGIYPGLSLMEDSVLISVIGCFNNVFVTLSDILSDLTVADSHVGCDNNDQSVLTMLQTGNS